MSRLIDGIPASMFEDSTSCPLAGKRVASCADAAKPVSPEKDRRPRGTCEYLRQREDSVAAEDRDHFEKIRGVSASGCVPILPPSQPVKIGTQGYDIKHCCVSPCGSTHDVLKGLKLKEEMVNSLDMNAVKDAINDVDTSGKAIRNCEAVNGEFGRIETNPNTCVLSDVNGNVTKCDKKDNGCQELAASHCDATGCLKKSIRSRPDRSERVGCRGNRHSRHCRESFNVISCKANESNFEKVFGDSCGTANRTNLIGRRGNRQCLEHSGGISNKDYGGNNAFNDSCINENRIDQIGYENNHMDSFERVSCKSNEKNFKNASKDSCCDGKSFPSGGNSDNAFNDSCINENRVDQIGYEDNHQYMDDCKRVSCTANEGNASKDTCCDGMSLSFGNAQDSLEKASYNARWKLSDTTSNRRRCRNQSLCAVPEIDSLSSLVEELHRIFEEDDVSVEYVEAVMRAYKSNPREWRRYAKFNKYKYTRNLVDAGNDKFNLMILCWGEGHGSSVHDHADAHCFMKMLDGALMETRYAWPASRAESDQPLTALSKTQLNVNDVCYINDSLGLHRVENSSYSDQAVSLHLYSPPFNACSVFNERTGHKTISRVTFWSKFGKRDKTNELTEGTQVEELEDN